MDTDPSPASLLGSDPGVSSGSWGIGRIVQGPWGSRQWRKGSSPGDTSGKGQTLSASTTQEKGAIKCLC